MPRLMFTIEVGAAAKKAAAGMRRARFDQLSERPRADEVEERQRIHYAPPLRFAPARPLLDGGKDAIGRHRQIVKAQSRGIGDGVGQRRQERRQRALAGLLGAEWPVRVDAFDDADLDRRRVPGSSARGNRACWR